jgi:murein DD-endopeptidase MepM/ murein hydrolase activator NlpD
MSGRLWIAILTAAIGAGSAGAAGPVHAGQTAPRDLLLQVTHHARALNPGEVVRVTVTADRPLRQVSGDAFGRSVPFWPDGDAGTWIGLVAIALGTGPGRHPIDIRATAVDGFTATDRVGLAVEGKTFATRRIQVAESFANPPASEVERILADQKRLTDTFARLRPERLWRGPFARPVSGDSTSAFGRLTILNGQPGSRHQGADLRAAEGTPVHAPNTGVVVLAANLYFSGNTVIVDHGFGLFSLFAHLSRMAVAEGGRVATGDLIGAAGATGRVTGPHLHWAVRMGEVSIDPLSLMVATADENEE